jgi:nitroimidazol reductase NimA-like FMN-containing flavoprotein (pyridoxamine 5'-phosphate oxidase superfamily)
MPRLSPGELDAFLDEPGHLLRVASVDEDGWPRVVPLWFVRDGDELVFTPRSAAVLLANVRRDPRLALSVDEDAVPYRKLSLQAPARIVHELGEDDEWRDLYRTIAKRYIPEREADAYVDGTIDQPRALLAVPLGGEGVRRSTWRMPVPGEDPTGIWHRRYYAEGTRLASRATTSSNDETSSGST